MTVVRPAEEGDATWVKPLWDENSHILGNLGSGTFWYRAFTANKNPRQKVLVIPDVAFAHFLQRNDGVNVLYEIAVSRKARRQGHGRALLDAIGRPMELKTDTTNAASNAFYQALGFRLLGRKVSADGKRTMNVWRLW